MCQLGVPYEGDDGIDPVKFPHGLKYVTDKIREIGLRPAIWIMTHALDVLITDYGFEGVKCELTLAKEPKSVLLCGEEIMYKCNGKVLKFAAKCKGKLTIKL